jgi:lipoprotein-releasing system permease protein
MKRLSWTLLVSGRWLSARRSAGGSAPSALAAAGIAVGVAALIVVLGVMNGFQLGYIDTILEVSSYHVRIDLPPQTAARDALTRKILSERGVTSAVGFAETQVLVGSNDGRSLPMKLRALPPSAWTGDRSFTAALGLPPEGPRGGEGLVIGSELARYLNVAVGDQVTVMGITSSKEEGVTTHVAKLPVSAVYHSGFYDFDSGLGFIGQDDPWSVFPKKEDLQLTLGIKLANRDQDAAVIARLAREGIMGAQGWRDYNRAFFGALRTEKTVMMLLVGLIFVVVGVNIYQSMRRSVHERMEEIALLKSFGGRVEDIRSIFLADGLIIGLTGALAGLVAGLLIASNINGIFTFASAALNWLSSLVAGLGGRAGADLSIYSPRYFYLMEVPVRILYPETVFVVASAIASVVAAAAQAAAHVASFEPAELLRHE